MTFIEYQRRTLYLFSMMIENLPPDLDEYTETHWLQCAFFCSQLHKHLTRKMRDDQAFRYVNKLLRMKRNVEIGVDMYEVLRMSGRKPQFVRFWRKWTHYSLNQLDYHASIFREYLEPESTYVESLLH